MCWSTRCTRPPSDRRPHGAVAVPADVAPLRQPALSPCRGNPRVRRPDQARPGATAAVRSPAAGRPTRRHRPRQRMGGQARGAQAAASVPRSAGRELAYAAFRDREGRALDDFATWCALAEKYGGDWHRWPESLQHPDAAGVADFVERTFEHDRFPPLAAVATRRTTRLGAVAGDPGRNGVGHHGRPGRRRASQRRRRLGASGCDGAGRDRGCAAGRVQPARPGLVTAAVASGPARGAGVPTLSRADPGGAAACRRRPHRPHHRIVPAVVDPARAHHPPKAPTCATTTMR